MTEEQKVYEIYEENYYKLEEILNKYNRKAVKLNMPEITFNVISEEFKEIEDKTKLSQGKIVKLLHVTVQGEIPVISGFQLVATIEHTENGNIINNVSGVDVPEYYRTAPIKCDHCHTNRYRTNSYIIRNIESGEYIQIGKNCLADYLSSTDVNRYISWLDKYLNIIEECKQGITFSGCFGEGYYTLEKYLACVCHSIKSSGWISSTIAKEYNKCSTADAARFAYEPCYSTDQKLINAWRKSQPTEEDYGLAKEITKYIREVLTLKENKSEYENNLCVLCAADHFKPKNAGYIASAYVCYQKYLEREQEKKQKEEQKKTLNNEHIGNIGERINITCKVQSIHYLESDFGVTKLHRMIDNTGHVLVWFSSSLELPTGKEITIKGTIKNHSEYKGTKQTVLSRCKLIA